MGVRNNKLADTGSQMTTAFFYAKIGGGQRKGA
jgi:hypothetical protein